MLGREAVTPRAAAPSLHPPRSPVSSVGLRLGSLFLVKRAHTTTDTEETNPMTQKPSIHCSEKPYPASKGRSLSVREMPAAERPRERLSTSGADALSDPELLSILLRSGRQGVSSIELARELLNDVGGLDGLVGSSLQDLHRPGIGPAKAATLHASVELSRRLARASVDSRPILGRPAAAARYLDLRYRQNGQEVLGALYLDTRQRVIHDEAHFRGTLDRCAAEPRVFLRTALLRHAKSFILFHTHPSGDPRPSVEDLTFTRSVREAASAIGIQLNDHLILGATGQWVSLRERGEW